MCGSEGTISCQVLFEGEATVELIVRRCFGYGERCQDREMRMGESCLGFEKKKDLMVDVMGKIKEWV